MSFWKPPLIPAMSFYLWHFEDWFICFQFRFEFCDKTLLRKKKKQSTWSLCLSTEASLAANIYRCGLSTIIKRDCGTSLRHLPFFCKHCLLHSGLQPLNIPSSHEKLMLIFARFTVKGFCPSGFTDRDRFPSFATARPNFSQWPPPIGDGLPSPRELQASHSGRGSHSHGREHSSYTPVQLSMATFSCSLLIAS